MDEKNHRGLHSGLRPQAPTSNFSALSFISRGGGGGIIHRRRVIKVIIHDNMKVTKILVLYIFYEL